MYHGVSTDACFTLNGRHIPANEFENHLLYYIKHFKIVPLSEIALLRRKLQTNKDLIISLTFDDGFKNNLNVVLPLLEKYKIPATFFITTASIEQQKEILDCELLEIGCSFSGLNELYLGTTLFKRYGMYNWQSYAGTSIYNFFQQQKPEEKIKLISEWKEKYKIDELSKKISRQYYEVMNEAEIRQLASSSFVEIGSHTHSHHYLNLLDDLELEFELAHSKSILERITDEKIESIALPDGQYDERVLSFCRRAGYKNLVNVGLNRKEDNGIIDLFPRVGSSNSDGIAFNMITISRFFNIHGF